MTLARYFAKREVKGTGEPNVSRPLAHYLGHRNLQSTARYTALAPDLFAKFLEAGVMPFRASR